MNQLFHQEWYGTQAKILEQTDGFVVVDYGCEGRYECEFANHTVSYLPEGYFQVASTQYLPVSFSFPLGKCFAISLVIDRQSLSEAAKGMMREIPIYPERIGETLGIERRWYTAQAPAKLLHLFSEMYKAKGTETVGYFKIKAMELLYHMDLLTQVNGCDFQYFDRGQIQAVKAIWEYLAGHLDEKISLENLAKEAHLNPAVFQSVYGILPKDYRRKKKSSTR